MSINRSITQQELDWLDQAVEQDLFAAPRPDTDTLQAMAANVENAARMPHTGCCGGHGGHCCGCHHHK